MILIMLFQICYISSLLTASFALQLNFYSSVGQVRREITVKDGDIQVYLTHQEYDAIIPGTIDFPDQRLIEQDLYNSNEDLRDRDVYVRFNNMCDINQVVQAKLIDPYSLLIKYDSSRYAYVSRDQIEFVQDPFMDGMVLSARLGNSMITKTNMTYLTRGLWWRPRYEVIVIDDRSATLRALADINNEHQRSYRIKDSQLITGNIPLASTAVRAPASIETQRFELMSGPMSGAYPSISSTPDSTNFGSYSYNIAHEFSLLPKSIKTFPFISVVISFNYTLETSTFLTSGTNWGLFQRVFIIRPTEFLPAGIITFYSAVTEITFGQGRLPDTSKQTEQKISLGNDPDVRFDVISTIKYMQQTPQYVQHLDVNVTISNRKDIQTVSVKLTLNTAYHNTTLTLETLSSSNIKITQSSADKSILTVEATISPDQAERCIFSLILLN